MDYKILVADLIAKKIPDFSVQDIISTLTIPPEEKLGDLAYPCFKLSKQFKKAPQIIAEELAKSFEALPKEIEKVEAAGGYLNFYYSRPKYAKDVLDSYNLGVPKRDIGQGKVICIDYSSINIAKHFHMGHLSTTAIGGSLYRIFNYLGYKAVGINHLGDYGTQFGKLIVAFLKWGCEEALEKDGLDELQKLYVKYHDEAQKQPELDDEARSWSLKIEAKDPKAVEIYNRFKETTLSSIGKIYSRLGVEFDSYLGESFYIDKIEPVVSELKQKGLLKESDGAQVVDLEEYSMPPCLILRSDGASLYATRDIATALYRHNVYNFDKCLYVVAYQQNLHFKQFFKVIELMGYPWAKDLIHIAYGMVSLEDGSMSTRAGKVIKLADVLDKSVEKTLSIIQEKNPDNPDAKETAEAVGVGAVVFSALANSKIKDIVFSWDRVLNFDGETGPYLQYTHARACSVLKKGGVDYNSHSFPQELQDIQPDYLVSDDNTMRLLKLIESFPVTVERAAGEYEPSHISKLLIDIAQRFNKFYFDNKILDDNLNVRKTRLLITLAVKDCLRQGLELILLKPLEKM